MLGRGAVEDWAAVLESLVGGEPLAVARVTGVIMGLLGRMRCYDLQPLWEDICQDVLAAVIASAQRGAIRDPRAFIGYCSAITRNALARRIDQTRRARARQGRVEPEQLAAPERRDHDLDLRIDMSRALEALPEKHRAVIEAVYMQGRSYEEAASALCLPLGSLKRMQTQGLRMLREHVLGGPGHGRP